MTNIYKADTPAEDLIKVLQRLNACSKAMEHLYGLFPEKQLPNATVRDVLQTVPNQSWASWLLAVFGQKLDTKMRQILLSKINNPMPAFRLYLDSASLTGEEDKFLENIFKDKLPTAEQELKDGIVKRQKIEVSNGGN